MAGEDLVGRTAKTGGQENTQELDIGHGIRKKKVTGSIPESDTDFCFRCTVYLVCKISSVEEKVKKVNGRGTENNIILFLFVDI